jgi:TatD DNase family protein
MQLGVHSFINIHTHFKKLAPDEFCIRNMYLHKKITDLSSLNYYVSVGLHPWYVNSMSLTICADTLIEVASHHNVIAIGEIGLDKSIETPLPLQIQYFEIQLNVARALQKPIIVHAVKSYSEFIPYLKKSKTPFIFHQFRGNLQQAIELIKLGAYLSFGKLLWDDKIAAVFEQLPLNHLFFETDTASRLTITDVYNQAAKLRKLHVDDLTQMTHQNFKELFKQPLVG